MCHFEACLLVCVSNFLCTRSYNNPVFLSNLSSIAKELRVLETRQNSPNANKENVKPVEASASISRPIGKGVYLWRCHAIYHPRPSVFNPNFEALLKLFFAGCDFSALTKRVESRNYTL